LLNTCRSAIILPKTPAATRRRKPAAAKRSRTLRSAAGRDSVDSGVELDMAKKPRGHLDSVREKTDEEQTDSDTYPTSTRTVAEARRKTEENKENIKIGPVSDDVKQTDAENKRDRDQLTDKQLIANVISSPASVISTQVWIY